MWPYIAELMAGGARLSANELAAGTVATARPSLGRELASAALQPIAFHVGDKVGKIITGEDDDRD